LRRGEDSESLATREAEFLLELGRTGAAERILVHMKETYADSLRTLLMAAKIAMRKTNYAEAVAYADKALAQNSRLTLAYLIKGQSYYYNGQFQEALGALEKVREIEGEQSIVGRALRSQVNWELGLYNEAIQELQRALALNPGYEAAREQLIQMLTIRKRWEDLERLYSDTIAAQPRQVKGYIEAGRATLQQADEILRKGQRERAVSYYQKALGLMRKGWQISQETGRDQVRALDGYLTVLLRTGNHQNVLKLVDPYLKKDPRNATLLLHKAEACYRLNRSAEALALFGQVLALVETDPKLGERIMSEVFRVGTADQVLSWGKQQLQRKPGWAALHLALAGVYRTKGQAGQIIAELKAALASANEALAKTIRYQLALTYFGQQRWSEGLVLCQELLKTEPENADLINNIAYCQMQLGGQDAEAVASARKAFELKPMDINIMDTYAMALIRTGEYVQAEGILLRAIQEAQRKENRIPLEYEYHLGQAVQGQKRFAQALERLQRVHARLLENTDSQMTQWRERIGRLMEELQLQQSGSK